MANTPNINLAKPLGTDKALVSVLNDNSDKIDSFAGAAMDGIAIVANGNTHPAIASGQFVYVRNHGTLTQGLYRATAAIGSNAALTTSNLTADSAGGLNALKGDLDSLNSNIANIVNPINLGSQTTIDGLKTAIANAVSSVANGATVPIRFPFDAAIEPFSRYGVYEGTLYKHGATIWSGVFTPNGGCPVYIANTNGTWIIEGIALNSNMLKADTTTVTLSAKGSTVGAFTHAGYATISSDRYIVSVLPVLPNTDWIMTVSINANRHTIYCNANGASTITLIYTYI